MDHSLKQTPYRVGPAILQLVVFAMRWTPLSLRQTFSAVPNSVCLRES